MRVNRALCLAKRQETGRLERAEHVCIRLEKPKGSSLSPWGGACLLMWTPAGEAEGHTRLCIGLCADRFIPLLQACSTGGPAAAPCCCHSLIPSHRQQRNRRSHEVGLGGFSQPCQRVSPVPAEPHLWLSPQRLLWPLMKNDPPLVEKINQQITVLSVSQP